MNNKNPLSADVHALMMESAPVGFQMLELMDSDDLGTFTFRATNKACELQTGVDMKQFVDTSLWESMPDVVTKNMPSLLLYKRALDEKTTLDVGVVEYGDSKVKLGFYKVQVYHIHKNYIGIIFNNITAQIQAETQLRKKIKEVEENAKEMEQITYIASHDLQEPLTTIKSMVEWLRNRYEGELDDQGSRGVEFVIQSVGRMKLLIKDLMDFSRIGQEVQAVEEVNTQILVEEVITNLSASINQAKAVFELGDLPIVNGFRTDLRLLFQNLLSNSIKFRNPDTPTKIIVEVEDKENYWQFCIIDNGIGIDEKFWEKIFSMFKRLHPKNEYVGTGIGLAHSKKVVERHQGKIWVESEEGVGSSFYFTLAKQIAN